MEGIVPSEFNGMKVFSATKARDRDQLGEKVTNWIKGQQGKAEVVGTRVMQSSDSEFHCLSIVLFLLYR
jgi:hypothetical protein